MDENIEYRLSWGTLKYSFGANLSIKGSHERLFQDASKANKIYEFGLEGLITDDGSLVLPPIFKQVEVCSNFVYLLCEYYYWLVFRNGMTRGERIFDNDPDGHLFARDGKVGWEHDDEVVIPPLYDQVYKWWKFDVYFTQKGNDIEYFDRSGRHVLPDYPFEIELSAGHSHRVALLSKSSDPSGRNVVMYDNKYPVEVRVIERDEIVRRMTSGNSILPLKKGSLELFDSAFSYEFRAYETESDGKNPLKDCLNQLRKLHVFICSWHYLMNIRVSSDNDVLNAKDLRSIRHHFEDQEETVISFNCSIGVDNTLPTGTVKVFLVTFYYDHWPTSFGDAWEKACSEYNLERLKPALSEIENRVRDAGNPDACESLCKEMRRTSLPYRVTYSPVRSWDETEKVLSYLKGISQIPRNVMHYFAEKIERDLDDDISFRQQSFTLNLAKWFLKNGADPNAVHKGMTAMDIVLPHQDYLHIRIFIDYLQSYGGKTKKELRKEETSDDSLDVELSKW